jgi:hypothetical protein
MPFHLPSNFGLLAQTGLFTNDLAAAVQDTLRTKPVDVRQTVILFGSLTIIAVCLFVLAVYFFRRKKPPDKLQRSAWPASASNNSPVRSRLTTHSHKARRHHRRGPKFTTRNPTLAEKGGLPPRRDDSTPPAAL